MKTSTTVNALPSQHRVNRRQSDGSIRTHVYAWRGGPKIGFDEPDEVLEERQRAAVDMFGGTVTKTKERRKAPKRDRRVTLSLYMSRALQNAKQRAGKRKINFTVDAKVVAALLEKQGWRCAISGITFQPDYVGASPFAYNPFGISIDRLDCAQGYTRTNIRLVLTAVNFALNEWGEEIYLRIAKAVVARELLKDD